MKFPAFIFATILSAGINVEPIQNSIISLGDTIKFFAAPIAFVVLVIAGIAVMTGQQGRQWAKPTMLFVVIGMAVVIFASEIVNMIQSSLVQ